MKDLTETETQLSRNVNVEKRVPRKCSTLNIESASANAFVFKANDKSINQ